VRALRLLIVLILVTGAAGASLLLAARAARSLHASPLVGAPAPHPHPRRARRAPGRTLAPAARRSPTRQRATGAGEARTSGAGELALVVAVELAGGAVVSGILLAGLSVRRVRRRRGREYALYELHLSTHDEAKPQDLEDMMETIANVIRVFPAQRARDGQPYLALELICSTSPEGMEWSINMRCEPSAAGALDAAISAAYPDVRLGRQHAEQPLPRDGTLRVPGHVMRFRKQRSFVYPLLASGELLASPPLEQIARAQVGLGAPSVVRFQLTPTPSWFEELARRLYRRHENKLVRQERWGMPEGGLFSTLNRAEMAHAQRTQNRSLFWLETVIAAHSAAACKTVAAAVQSRRGENRLRRRLLLVRQGLYRRRFPHAITPLLPSPRCLISAAEAAHLLALPSARMKGVPVRRLTLPRIPAPPEALRAEEPETMPAPAPEPVERQRVQTPTSPAVR
jgi:hypothetical protein